MLVGTIDPDVLLKSLIDTLGLPIGFRMISRGIVKFHGERFTESPEERRNKFGTTIGSNMIRNTMLREDMNNKKLS